MKGCQNWLGEKWSQLSSSGEEEIGDLDTAESMVRRLDQIDKDVDLYGAEIAQLGTHARTHARTHTRDWSKCYGTFADILVNGLGLLCN